MAQSASRGASAPCANLRVSSPDLESFEPLARSAFDASDEVARRLQAYGALATLLHEQRDPDSFGCLTPAALEQLLLTLNAGMREAVASMSEAIDQLVASGNALRSHAAHLEA